MSRPTWPEHAMNLAFASALRSEDPHCQVGACVLAENGVVLGVGYNGTVSGLDIDWTDRDARRPFVIHAEANALRYTTPVLAAGGTLAVTHYPCAPCVVLAASYGIRAIHWRLAPDWDRYPPAPTADVAWRCGIALRQEHG